MGQDFGFPVPVTKATRFEVRHTRFLLLQDMDQEAQQNDVSIHPTDVSIREGEMLADTDNSTIQLLKGSLVIQKDSVSNAIRDVRCYMLRFPQTNMRAFRMGCATFDVYGKQLLFVMSGRSVFEKSPSLTL